MIFKISSWNYEGVARCRYILNNGNNLPHWTYPAKVSKGFKELHFFESPKSVTLILLVGPGSARRIFSNLRSWWQMKWLWRKVITWTIWKKLHIGVFFLQLATWRVLQHLVKELTSSSELHDYHNILWRNNCLHNFCNTRMLDPPKHLHLLH